MTTLRHAALLLFAFFALGFLIVVCNQVLQLSEFAAQIHPLAGAATFWTLLSLLALCALSPVILWLALPAPLTPPDSPTGPARQTFLRRLATRLSANPALGHPVTPTEAAVTEALDALDRKARDRTTATARQVFLLTALNQNGALDALIVLVSLIRLVWQIARLHGQRPGLKELTFLYSNVFTTAFVAGELDDAAIEALAEPLIQMAGVSTLDAVPGGRLFARSLLSGAANAFLTLRVGLVTARFCRALTRPNPAEIRHAAIREAASLLGHIVVADALRVSSLTAKMVHQKSVETLRAAAGRACDFVVSRVRQLLGQKLEDSVLTGRAP